MKKGINLTKQTYSSLVEYLHIWLNTIVLSFMSQISFHWGLRYFAGYTNNNGLKAFLFCVFLFQFQFYKP